MGENPSNELTNVAAPPEESAVMPSTDSTPANTPSNEGNAELEQPTRETVSRISDAVRSITTEARAGDKLHELLFGSDYTDINERMRVGDYSGQEGISSRNALRLDYAFEDLAHEIRKTLDRQYQNAYEGRAQTTRMTPLLELLRDLQTRVDNQSQIVRDYRATDKELHRDYRSALLGVYAPSFEINSRILDLILSDTPDNPNSISQLLSDIDPHLATLTDAYTEARSENVKVRNHFIKGIDQISLEEAHTDPLYRGLDDHIETLEAAINSQSTRASYLIDTDTARSLLFRLQEIKRIHTERVTATLQKSQEATKGIKDSNTPPVDISILRTQKPQVAQTTEGTLTDIARQPIITTPETSESSGAYLNIAAK